MRTTERKRGRYTLIHAHQVALYNAIAWYKQAGGKDGVRMYYYFSRFLHKPHALDLSDIPVSSLDKLHDMLWVCILDAEYFPERDALYHIAVLCVEPSLLHRFSGAYLWPRKDG